jgi:hypothetical protein
MTDMSTNESTNLKIEHLREQALASIEGDDPFRRQKVVEILSAAPRELEQFVEEVYA